MAWLALIVAVVLFAYGRIHRRRMNVAKSARLRAVQRQAKERAALRAWKMDCLRQMDHTEPHNNAKASTFYGGAFL